MHFFFDCLRALCSAENFAGLAIILVGAISLFFLGVFLAIAMYGLSKIREWFRF
jgi:hypothetical protein